MDQLILNEMKKLDCESENSEAENEPSTDSESGSNEVSSANLSPVSEVFDEDFSILDEEFVEKVKNQVEYYFSDEVILRDCFLLKHVRRSKEGYVSLKLISSFRKMKSLTKSNWKLVAFCLKTSSTLEVNDDGLKVRRLAPLPDYDETLLSRSVVAMNMPATICIEGVGEIFSKFGEILLIRICKPGGSIPPDAKKFSFKYPQFSSEFCALVEFEKFESAKKAMQENVGVEVLSLNTKITKREPLPPQEKSKNSGGRKKKYGKKPKRKQNATENTCPNTSFSPVQKSPEAGTSKKSQKIPKRKPQFAPGSCTGSFGEGDGTLVSRKLQSKDLSSLNSGNPDGFKYMPRGPDGTKGFDAQYVPLQRA